MLALNRHRQRFVWGRPVPLLPIRSRGPDWSMCSCILLRDFVFGTTFQSGSSTPGTNSVIAIMLPYDSGNTSFTVNG
jgi:hypothetical protein